jgi:hypothetical protein
LNSSRKIDIDLTKMSLEDLRALVSNAEHVLELRRFEERLGKAVQEFASRDPRIIRL